jgi:hypothetical protein
MTAATAAKHQDTDQNIPGPGEDGLPADKLDAFVWSLLDFLKERTPKACRCPPPLPWSTSRP